MEKESQLYFLQRTFLCVLGKRCTDSLSLCASLTRRTEPTVQGRLINDGTLVLGAEQGAHIFCVRLGSMRA